MTETVKIKRAIARDSRSAYKSAKASGRAYVTSGNTIYKVTADGSRTAISKVDGHVKAKVKTFVAK